MHDRAALLIGPPHAGACGARRPERPRQWTRKRWCRVWAHGGQKAMVVVPLGLGIANKWPSRTTHPNFPRPAAVMIPGPGAIGEADPPPASRRYASRPGPPRSIT